MVQFHNSGRAIDIKVTPQTGLSMAGMAKIIQSMTGIQQAAHQASTQMKVTVNQLTAGTINVGKLSGGMMTVPLTLGENAEIIEQPIPEDYDYILSQLPPPNNCYIKIFAKWDDEWTQVNKHVSYEEAIEALRNEEDQPEAVAVDIIAMMGSLSSLKTGE